MIFFLVPRGDESIVDDYIRQLGEELSESARNLCYEDFIEQATFEPGLYVFTGLNRLGPGATRLLGDVHAQLSGQGGFSFLNHPLETLRRYELLQVLHEEGLNDFKALGAWEDLSDLKFPAFVRHRSKDGGVPKLLHSAREAETEIGKILMDGGDISEILVVEFLDTIDSEGFYRKYSASFIGSHIIPMLMDRGKHWVMRSHAAEFTRDSLEEEKRFARTNPHEGELRRVVELSGVGFGRIDYSLRDGRVQTWEINTLPLHRAPPGAKPMPEELRPLRDLRFQEFGKEFSAVFREIHAQVPSGSPRSIQVDQEKHFAGWKEFSVSGPVTYPRTERFGALRGLLRPFKRLLKPLATRVLYPRMARSAMRAARKTNGKGR